MINRPQERIAYRYRVGNSGRAAGTSLAADHTDKWTPVREARLCAWLDRHGTNPDMLAFRHDGIALGGAVQRAVRTLFQDLIHRPLIQERLAECHRARTLASGAIDRPVASTVTAALPHGAQSLARTDRPADTSMPSAEQIFDSMISVESVRADSNKGDGQYQARRPIEETPKTDPGPAAAGAEAALRDRRTLPPDLSDVEAQPDHTEPRTTGTSGKADPTIRKESTSDGDASNAGAASTPPHKAGRRRGPGIRGQAQSLSPPVDRQMPKGPQETLDPNYRPMGRER